MHHGQCPMTNAWLPKITPTTWWPLTCRHAQSSLLWGKYKPKYKAELEGRIMMQVIMTIP